MSAEEHRQAPRVVRGFMVRYRRPSDRGWSVSPLRDLSSSGARFLSEQTFPVGTKLELRLVLPTTKEPLALQARVARIMPGPMDLAEYGVTFEVNAAGVQEIVTALAHFVHKQDKP